MITWNGLALELLTDEAMVRLLKETLSPPTRLTADEQRDLKIHMQRKGLGDGRRVIERAADLLTKARALAALRRDEPLEILRLVAGAWLRLHGEQVEALCGSLGAVAEGAGEAPDFSAHEIEQALSAHEGEAQIGLRLGAAALVLGRRLARRRPAEATPELVRAPARLRSMALRMALSLLRDEPHDSPAWAEIDAFVGEVRELTSRKRNEAQIVGFSRALSDLASRWESDLGLLGLPVDIGGRVRAVRDEARAQEGVLALSSLLAEQQALVEQHDTSLRERQARFRRLAALIDPLTQAAADVLASIELDPADEVDEVLSPSPPLVEPPPPAPPSAATRPASIGASAPAEPSTTAEPPSALAATTPAVAASAAPAPAAATATPLTTATLPAASPAAPAAPAASPDPAARPATAAPPAIAAPPAPTARPAVAAPPASAALPATAARPAAAVPTAAANAAPPANAAPAATTVAPPATPPAGEGLPGGAAPPASAKTTGGLAPEPALPVRPREVSAATIEPGVILCLDFGTARSKAFATRRVGSDELALPLRLGVQAAGEPEEFSLVSSVWIDDDGRLYFGQQAIDRSREEPTRARLDSLKDYFSTVDTRVNSLLDPRKRIPGADVDSQRDDPNRNEARRFNPFVDTAPLSYGDLLLLYLGFLTGAAERALRQSGVRGQVRRRFALPSWQQGHQQQGKALLRSYLGRAMLVADAVGDGWGRGLPVTQAKRLVEEVFQLPDEQLPLGLFEADHGVSEPVAAAGTRLRRDEQHRGLVMVVDVGAGTSDFGLFLVDENPEKERFHFVEVETHSVSAAGNRVDALLANFVFQRLGSVGAIERDNLSREFALRARQLKETLFVKGSVTVSLLGGKYTTVLTSDEFVAACAQLASLLKAAFVETMSQANREGGLVRYVDPVRGELLLPVVLTGGGATLPMVAQLAHLEAELPSPPKARPVRLRCRPTELLSKQAQREGMTVAQYLPLAVAWGGSLPDLPTMGKAPLPSLSGGGGAVKESARVVHATGWRREEP